MRLKPTILVIDLSALLVCCVIAY